MKGNTDCFYQWCKLLLPVEKLPTFVPKLSQSPIQPVLLFRENENQNLSYDKTVLVREKEPSWADKMSLYLDKQLTDDIQKQYIAWSENDEKQGQYKIPSWRIGVECAKKKEVSWDYTAEELAQYCKDNKLVGIPLTRFQNLDGPEYEKPVEELAKRLEN